MTSRDTEQPQGMVVGWIRCRRHPVPQEPYETLRAIIDEEYEQQLRDGIANQSRIMLPFVSTADQFKQIHAGSSIERTLPIECYLAESPNKLQRKVLFPHLRGDKRVVTWAELLYISNLQANGEKLDDILEMLKTSVPESSGSSRESAMLKKLQSEDSGAFEEGSAVDPKDTSKVVDAIMEVALWCRDLLEKMSNNPVKHTHSNKKKLALEKQKILCMLQEYNKQHPDSRPSEQKPPRYLFLAGNETQNEQPNTRIDWSTDPLRLIKLNNEKTTKGKMQQPTGPVAWFPCLIIHIPNHIDNKLLKQIIQKWRGGYRNIPRRCLMGVAIALAIDGMWFLHEKLNSPHYKLLSCLFRKNPLFHSVNVLSS